MQDYKTNISKSGLSIYDAININDEKLWIPSQILEEMLNKHLTGLSLRDLPLRTRSKVLKGNVCEALGYPIPKSFQKTKPRFPGQNFDTYVQKSNNLQIWNEEVEPSRRYVILRLSSDDIVQKAKVISGQELSLLDKTGTLTKKYQARVINISQNAELVTPNDTDNIASLGIENNVTVNNIFKPTDFPTKDNLLPIRIIFENLKRLVGKTFEDNGYDQERNRGAGLHELVCKVLGYDAYLDNGRFPDLINQLIEVKLQTSPTIDLGLISPNSTDILDIPKIDGVKVRHCDVRYAIFYGKTDGKNVQLTNLFLTTGEKFFDRFPQFQGKVINAKIQIPLPRDFFL